MTERQFLFCAGECTATMKAVFSLDNWTHTMSAKRFELLPNFHIRRSGITEDIKGIVYFAHVENRDLDRKNLELISVSGIPCWPNADDLLRMIDRHEVMRECVFLGLTSHTVQFVTHGEYISITRPFVIKTGQQHRGEGKFIVCDGEPIPEWEGVATVEPFFKGRSARVLIIGDRQWVIEFDNKESWIKNSAGADIISCEELDRSSKIVQHACVTASVFGLDVAGVDYIVDDSGDDFHFLEVNQFPGVNVSDDVVEHSQKYFIKMMETIEKDANVKY